MTRSEYMNIIKNNKELLDLGLMTQDQYDKEFRYIKHNMNY